MGRDPSATNTGRQAIRSEPLPPPPGGSAAPPSGANLAPLAAQTAPGLPYELWQGLSVADFEARLARLEIPPRSPAVHRLWRRLITAEVAAPAGGEGDVRFAAVRAEALDRSGLASDAAKLIARETARTTEPVLLALAARSEIGQGRREAGCAVARDMFAAKATLPDGLKGEAILMAGYCAAAQGQREAAALQAGLAREVGLSGEPYGADALEALAAGSTLAPRSEKPFTLLDWRIVSLDKPQDAGPWIAVAAPSLLAALANDTAIDPASRLEAAEAAARLNIVSAEELAGIYRATAPATELSGLDLGSAEGLSQDGAARRAALFKAAEAERTPQRKTRLIRALLDSARRAGLYWPALGMMANPAATVVPVPEIGWFTETAIETALAAGRFEEARKWAAFGETLDRAPGAAGFAHWIALADLADPAPSADRTASLAAVERIASNGRLDGDTLHRLATVLDALEVTVPMPLWTAVGKVPEPKTGHLPETGLLSQLADASKKKEFGRTVLLAMEALGPSGAEGAHILALGDSIRALKRAGLEPEARALALEAVFASWPRAVMN